MPFEIPKSWVWVRLSELGFMERGHGIKRNETSKKGLPCLRYGEIYTSYIYKFSYVKSYISQDLFNQCNKISNGDLVFTLTGENKIDIAKTIAYHGTEDVAIGGDLAKWTCHCCDADFLSYMMYSNFLINQKKNNATGDIIVHISVSKVGDFLFPLPPLNEQKRIVAKIEELLPLVDEYSKAQEALDKLNAKLPDNLRKSILQQAIEGKLVPQDPNDEPASELLKRINTKLSASCDNQHYENAPFEIPKSWAWVRFSDIANRYIGKTPERGNARYWNEHKYHWVSISDMSNYGIINETKEFISEEASKIMRKISPKGSLIMSFKLTVGKTSILNIDAFHNEAIITIIPYVDNENALRDYLFTFLPLITQYGNSVDAIKGITLNSTSIANLLIPLPPLNEQKRIVAKIEQLFSALDTITTLLK